jgi:hypothetical protein
VSWVAVGVGGASLLGGIFGASASEQAAQQQAQAAEQAQQISEQEFQTITGQESPFIQSGYGSLGQLNYLLGNGTPGTAAQPGVGMLGGNGSSKAFQGTAPVASSSQAGSFGSLLSPFNVSNWQQLSPAYNFQMQQGQQNVLNSDAAGQGSLSGAALKDLTNYNQGLANTSFNNAFNQYQTQQGNIFSRLSGIAQLGQAAATNTGQQGTALAGQAGQAAQNIGTALAGGTVGAANAITGGLSSAAPWLAYGGGAPGGGYPYVPAGEASPGAGAGTVDAGGGYTFSG